MAPVSLHDRVLQLPHPVSSSGQPLTAEMARENQVFINTFIDNIYLQEFNSFKAVQRPCQITAGKPAQVTLNSHRIKSFPKKDIFQYDVSLRPLSHHQAAHVCQVVVGSGVEKRIVVRKAWGSHDVQSKFPPGVIFDGNKLAW